MQKVYRNSKKMKKRIALLITLLMVASVCIGVNIPTQAANMMDQAEPYYVGIADVSCTLGITSGKATCSGNISLRSGYSASLTLKLQQSKDGSSWSTLKTWTATGSRISKSYYVSSGYKYRATFNVKVYNSSGTLVDNLTKTSAIKSY